MATFAVWTGVARLGTDVTQRTVGANDTMMSKARMVTNRRVNEGGEWKDAPSWYSIVAFGYPAEVLAGASKGELICVVGEPSVSEWTTREGETRVSLEVKATRVQLLNKKASGRSEGYPKPDAMADAKEDRQADRQPTDADIPF